MAGRSLRASKTRRALACALVALAAIGIACSGGGLPVAEPEAAAQASPPSIVFVLADDLRADQIARMPSVKRLAAAGVTFKNAYVSNSLCCPSRATILTGRYSHGTGVYGNDNSQPHGGRRAFIDDEPSTAATWLRAAGYRTGLIGKYLNGYRTPGPVPPGWDRWFAYVDSPGYYDYTVSDNGTLATFGAAPADYATDVFADRAVDFIRTTPAGQPLFLYFAPYAPHVPNTPPPRYANTLPASGSWHPPNFNEADVSDKPAWVQALGTHEPAKIATLDAQWARQAESLLAVDDALRAIEGALQDTGRLATTMVVFTSDNGVQWASHRFLGKESPYRESSKVPLVVRYDPITAGRSGSANQALVGNIDFAPTFAELAGVAAPGAEGRSLLALLRDPTAPWRTHFLLEHLQNPGNKIPTYCGVVSRGRKLVEYQTGEAELYDLVADPWELRNVAGDPAYADAQRNMHAKLVQMCSPPPPGFAPQRTALDVRLARVR